MDTVKAALDKAIADTASICFMGVIDRLTDLEDQAIYRPDAYVIGYQQAIKDAKRKVADLRAAVAYEYQHAE